MEGGGVEEFTDTHPQEGSGGTEDPTPPPSLTDPLDHHPPPEDDIRDGEHAAQEPLMLNLSNSSVNMEDEDQQEEEEEEEQEEEDEEEQEEEEEEDLLVFDPNHPLVLKQQTALSRELRKHLERMKLDLREKRKLEKADAGFLLELQCDLFREQEEVVKMQKKLQDLNRARTQAEVQHQQVQQQLEETIKQSSATSQQNDKAQHSASELQAELDQLMLLLLTTREDWEDLRSQLKTTNNVLHKARAQRSQAEEEKLKQDLYVERLTKDLERLTQQRETFVAQVAAQREETKAVKESLALADLDMEVLAIPRNQLVRQWRASLLAMGRQDQALSAMQEAVGEGKHQLLLLDREIQGFQKSIAAEEEQNESLTLQLNCCQMEGTALKKTISHRQSQQEALSSHYSKCAGSLQETAATLAAFTKETVTQQAELENQRKQKEKSSSIRKELEERIHSHFQQQLSYSNAAMSSHRLTNKTTALKTEKRIQLQLQEKDTIAVKLESHNVLLQVEALALTQDALHEEIQTLNKFLTLVQTRTSSLMKAIEKKQATITTQNKKISEIVASTANEDLSPLEIKIHAITAQMEALAATFNRDKQQWMKLQETDVENTLENEANRREILLQQTENTGMQQKRLRLESQIEFEQQVAIELEKNLNMLYRDQLKLNSLLGKNQQLNQQLEQDNALMEAEFKHKLKEEARECVELQMRYENMQEEKELILASVVEAQQHIMLWEKKAQIVSETQAAVDSDMYKGQIQMLRTEIHRREVELSCLMKHQEELVRQSETAVERWSSVIQRKTLTSSKKMKQKATKGDLHLNRLSLQRSIRETNTLVGDCTKAIQELHQSGTSLSERLMQQRQQMIELSKTCHSLDSDLMKLQDTNNRLPEQVKVLLSRGKRLQEVKDGGYKVSVTGESVEAAVQKLTQRLYTVSIISQRVCEEFPQHQEVLHRFILEVAAHNKK